MNRLEEELKKAEQVKLDYLSLGSGLERICKTKVIWARNIDFSDERGVIVMERLEDSIIKTFFIPYPQIIRIEFIDHNGEHDLSDDF